MPAKATVAPGYQWRLALLWIGCTLFGLWCLRDAIWKFPEETAHWRWRENEREKLKKIYGDQEALIQKDLKPKWEAYTQSIGKTSEYDPADRAIGTWFNWGMLTLCGTGGIVFCASWWSYRKRWIASDEKGIFTSWGVRVPFESIVRLNKERWERKGIAVLWHKSDKNATERRLVLDDWKFNAKMIKTILIEIEGKLKPDQIVGGQPERKPDAANAAKVANPATTLNDNISPRRE